MANATRHKIDIIYGVTINKPGHQVTMKFSEPRVKWYNEITRKVTLALCKTKQYVSIIPSIYRQVK